MLSFKNTKVLLQRLSKLSVDTPAAFGKMKPQHMVEHLIFTLMISVGKLPQKLFTPEGKLPLLKQILHSSKELPVGVKAPMLPDNPLPLVYPDLGKAIMALKEELKAFDEYYKLNPDAIHVHPVFGYLNKHDWIIFHSKHFNHHFRQFGL